MYILHFNSIYFRITTDLDHPGDLHADQPGVGGGLAVEGEAAAPPVHNHNIDILRGDQGSGHILTDNKTKYFRFQLPDEIS